MNLAITTNAEILKDIDPAPLRPAVKWLADEKVRAALVPEHHGMAMLRLPCELTPYQSQMQRIVMGPLALTAYRDEMGLNVIFCGLQGDDLKAVALECAKRGMHMLMRTGTTSGYAPYSNAIAAWSGDGSIDPNAPLFGNWRIDHTGQELPQPCPIDGPFFEATFTRLALDAVKLSLDYPLAGVQFDPEGVAIHQAQLSGPELHCYCDRCMTRFAEHARLPFNLSAVGKSKRLVVLRERRLLEPFMQWQENELYQLADDLRRRVQAINPDFIISLGMWSMHPGDDPLENAAKHQWYFMALAKGFSTAQVPTIIWHWTYWLGYSSWADALEKHKQHLKSSLGHLPVYCPSVDYLADDEYLKIAREAWPDLTITFRKKNGAPEENEFYRMGMNNPGFVVYAEGRGSLLRLDEGFTLDNERQMMAQVNRMLTEAGRIQPPTLPSPDQLAAYHLKQQPLLRDYLQPIHAQAQREYDQRQQLHRQAQDQGFFRTDDLTRQGEISASGWYSRVRGPTMAADDDLFTGWHQESYKYPCWWQATWDKPRRISSIRVLWLIIPTNFSFQVSPDGQQWHSLKQWNNCDSAFTLLDLDTPLDAQYLRVFIESSNRSSYAGITEIAILP